MKKIALVTGAGSEIGKETIKLLVNEGYFVYALSREKTDSKSSAIKDITLDITNEVECKNFFEVLEKKKERINLLVNIAGRTISGPSLSYSNQELRLLLEVNLIAPFSFIKNVYPTMKNRGGRIVNITSLNGVVSMPYFGLYSASKFALSALGNALFYELKNEKVFITNIIPGAIKREGPKVDFSHKPAREKFIFLKILMPMLSPKEVANRIYSIALSKTPPAEVVMGCDARIIIFLKRLLPSFVWEKLMLYIWQKK